MKMNKKTLEALKASIQHWKENESAETVDLVSVFGEDCERLALEDMTTERNALYSRIAELSK